MMKIYLPPWFRFALQNETTSNCRKVTQKYLLGAFLMLSSIGLWAQVTLPHTRTVWNSTPTGWTDNAGGSYTTSFACSGDNGGKFELSNHTYLVHLNSLPDKLSFVVKSNASTTSSLLVEESDTGLTYATVISLSGTTDLPTNCTTKGPYALKSTSRYIRWTFTKGSQNMTMDDVSITAPACIPPANPIGSVSGITPSCSSTILNYSGADAATAYWQTSPTGKSTTEPANSTKTVSTSGTYYIRIYDGVSCWSTGTASKTIVVNAPTNITVQPSNANITTGINCSFTVTASGVTSYQWQVDTGSGFTNLSNGAPYSNVTAPTLNMTNATLAMNGYKYRCVLIANIPCTNTTTNGLATLTVTNAAPNNALNLASCIANNQVTIKWTAPTTGAAPTGYIVFVQPNATVPQMAASAAGNASSYTANTNYSLAASYTTLGKVVYKGNSLTATITGFTNLSQYTFKVVAYTGETETGWAAGIGTEGSWNQTYTIDVPEITNLAATINPTTSTVSWNVIPSSASCYEYMVVANNCGVTLAPSGNGSAYPANGTYSGVNSVVYKGTGNSIIVRGLTEGVNYCYKVFVREEKSGNQWSDGVSFCQTTGINYCVSTGGANNSGILNVNFNTINQTSSSTAGYTDYSAVSTNVILGTIHDLSVKVNTNGNHTSYVKAWIDWNKNGAFDSNEGYELGAITNNSNGTPSASPVSITVPTNATIGNVRLRIAANTEDSLDRYTTPCQLFTFGEVEDYTITVIQPVNAEINVKGETISIPNGFDSPNGLNNTLFGTTPLNTDSVDKQFTIENIGIANLNLTGSPIIKIEGANAVDFIVTQQAITPVVNGINVTFKIKFHPTVTGLRTANVRIESNDSDENPYIFAIEGTGNCTIAPTIKIFPTSGPPYTLVSFTSTTSSLIGATVTYNNLAVPITYNTTDRIEVIVPAGANDGNFSIQLATGCNKTQAFDVIDTYLNACETLISGGDATDLFIYEVYDENGGSGGVVTIYNNTGDAVNLSNYSIQRAATYGNNYSTYANLSGDIAAGTVAIISVSSSTCGYTPTGNGSFGATGFNANDGFRLMKGAMIIDDIHAPNYVGYYLKRKITNFYPNPTFNASEWTTQSIIKDDCLAGVGSVPLIRVSPTINTDPVYVINCGITGGTLTVQGTEGVSGGLGLTYQWYVLGTSGNWTAVIDGGVYAGATTKSLTFSDINGLDDYQYYCQIRENSATCYTATKSTQIRIGEKTWDGANWLGRGNISVTAPAVIDKIKLNGNYNTFTNGNLNGCSLKNNNPFQLTISGGTYANIEGNIINDGTMLIESDGNLLQKNNAATFTGTPIIAKRNIVVSALRQQYNYLISPLVGQSLKTVYTPEPIVQYHSENNNRFYSSTGAYIDGRGLAVKEPASGSATTATFIGAPKNGIVNYNIIKGDLSDSKRGYNLVGNPYPSNINLATFYALNSSVMESTVYFWDNKGNVETAQQGNSYGGQSYANFNIVVQTGIKATGDFAALQESPTNFVKTGQGFMVQSKVTSSNLHFNNTIRTTENGATKFFGKNAIVDESAINRFWLNMITPNNIASNIAIVYFPEGNNTFTQDDSRSIGGSDALYSIVENEKVGINGRSAFVDTDVIPLGSQHFVAGNYTIAIDRSEGIFVNGQNIYLKDIRTGVLTNLSEENYTFAANTGESTGRFEIIYKPETVLATNEKVKENLIIYGDGNNFVVKAKSKKITSIEVFDGAGRLTISLNPNNMNVNIRSEKLVKGVYVLKINQNGQVTYKKIIR